MARQFLGLEGVEWRFWLLWVLASALGWTMVLVVLGPWASDVTDGENWLVTLVWTVLGAGAVFVAAQWLILRKRLRWSGWWVLASAVAWAVAIVGAMVAVGPSFIVLAVGEAWTRARFDGPFSAGLGVVCGIVGGVFFHGVILALGIILRHQIDRTRLKQDKADA